MHPTAGKLSIRIRGYLRRVIGNDVTASATFVKQHIGFKEDMSADDFVSLSRQDAGFNLIFLRTGLESFKPS